MAREYHTRQVHYLSKTVSYSDAGIADGGLVKFNEKLPKGAFVTQTFVDVKTVFNAATTNVLTVGSNSTTTNNIVAAGDVNEASAQMFAVTGVGVLDADNDLDVYVKYTQTGTEATTGEADIVLCYIPKVES